MSAGQVSLKGKREARYRIVARFHSELRRSYEIGRVTIASLALIEYSRECIIYKFTDSEEEMPCCRTRKKRSQRCRTRKKHSQLLEESDYFSFEKGESFVAK